MTASATQPQTSDDGLLMLAQSSPAGLMLATEPRWTLPKHLDLIDGLLVRVAAGELRRVVVTVPVRHGKSEMCSRFFPAWLLGMFPDRRVVVAGYGAQFAEEWGAKARNLLEEHGPHLFGTQVDRGSRSRSRWTVRNLAGGMFAVGVGGALTGRGADVLVIDDPHKNAEEADSEVVRDKVWDWYWSTARTRLEPGGSVVILMARWHEDDLVGRLLDHPDDVEPWTVVNLPALAEDDDPLGRDPGEPLWPERYGRTELEAVQQSMPTLWWNALYQQRPSPAEGFMFKRSHFRYWSMQDEPVGANVRHWYVLADDDGRRRYDQGECTHFQTADVALSSKDTADWTVVATWAVTSARDLLLVDLERRRFEEQQTSEFLMRVCDKHARPPMWVERFGAGRSPLARLRREGYPVLELPDEAGTRLDKVTRAFGAIALYEAGKVFHPPHQPDWLGAFEDELCSFDRGRWDDQVDVTSYAARLVPIVGGRQQAQSLDPPGPRPQTAGIMSRRF